MKLGRVPSTFNLTLAMVLGPTVALWNQLLIYAADTWVCGRGYQGSLNLIPAFGLVITLVLVAVAYRNLKAVGALDDDDHGGVDSRIRFMAYAGVAISIFSSLVIVAQWASILVYGACMRAT